MSYAYVFLHFGSCLTMASAPGLSYSWDLAGLGLTLGLGGNFGGSFLVGFGGFCKRLKCVQLLLEGEDVNLVLSGERFQIAFRGSSVPWASDSSGWLRIWAVSSSTAIEGDLRSRRFWAAM